MELSDPLKLGFWYPPSYSMNTWLEHDAHGDYPNGRAYDDQPVRLLEDWHTLDERYDHIYQHLKEDEHWLPETVAPFIEPIPEPTPEVHVNGKPRGLFGRARGG